jgi:hypothetical protein
MIPKPLSIQVTQYIHTRITEHLVSEIDVCHFPFNLFFGQIPSISIRVPFQRLFPIRSLDLIRSSITRHVQNLVIVSFGRLLFRTLSSFV